MLDNLECPVCPALANDCTKLLKKKNLTTLHFEIELCKISCRYKDCIDGFRWRPEPSMPEELAKFLGMPKNAKDIWIDQHPTFFLAGNVPAYLDQRDMIRNGNNRNMFVLKGWLHLPVLSDEVLEGINEDDRRIIEKVLNTYSGRMK